MRITDTQLAELIENDPDDIMLDLQDARAILHELDLTFSGRDADGAPSAEGSYWLGHSLAIKIWYFLHPELLPPDSPPLDF